MIATLEACVSLLVDKAIISQSYPDGRHDVRSGLSLLQQLRECVANNGGGKGNGSGRWQRAPISMDALDLMESIEREWGKPPESQLSGLLSWSLNESTRDYLLRRLRLIIMSIEQLLDPPRHYHLAAPCPVCAARVAYRRDSGGQVVQTPALVVDGTTGALCLACGSTWPVSELEFLGRMLGCVPLR